MCVKRYVGVGSVQNSSKESATPDAVKVFHYGRGTCSSKLLLFLEEDKMLKRPRPRFLMTLFSLSSLLILLLSACGAPQGGGNGGGGTGGTAVKGGTWINDLYEEPDSLIGNASSETYALMVDQTIYTPLFVG